MNKSLFEEKGALRNFNRAIAGRPLSIMMSAVTLAAAWYMGWSPFVESHWALTMIGVWFAVLAIWLFVFACHQKSKFQIHMRKKLVISTRTTWLFKTNVRQYAWDQFSGVRTLLFHPGEYLVCQVELVTCDLQSALPIAIFPAVAKPGKSSPFEAQVHENPLAVQMRAELSQLMSLTNYGTYQAHQLMQLE